MVPFLATAWTGIFAGRVGTLLMSVIGAVWLSVLGALDVTPLIEVQPLRTLFGAVAALGFLSLLVIQAREQTQRALEEAAEQAESAARNADARRTTEDAYRAVVESSRDGIVLLDLQGNLLTYNEATVNTGWTVEELVNRPYLGLSVLPPEELPRAAALFAQLLAEGRLDDVPITALHKDGRRLSLRVSANVLALPETGNTGIAVTVRDLSPQVEADARKRELEAALHQARRLEAIGRLAGGVAHDFNNVLMVVLNNAALLQQPREDAPELLEEIEAAAERAAGLTAQLMAVGRRQVLKPHPTHWPTLLKELDPLLRRIGGERVRLVQDHPRDVPAVLADPAQLQQVVVNLVANAVDASPFGAGVTLRTSRERGGPGSRLPEGDWVVLHVIDAGQGMDAETLTRVFEPFFTTKDDDGTGLGLATVYGIVQQSNGALDVQSRVGAGTHFRVALPVASNLPPTSVVAGSGRSDGASVSRVLVVEDMEEVRRSIERLLVGAGARPRGFSDPRDALAWARAHPADRPDVLIADFVMPTMTGEHLATELRKLWPDLPVLYVSGYPKASLRDDDRRTAFLPKPFTGGELTEAIQKIQR